MPERIKLVHCSRKPYYTGGGLERMDYYLCRHLDRDLIDPRFVILEGKQEGKSVYDPSAKCITLDGSKSRFNQLLAVFADADVVTYSTVDRFQPLVAESARAAKAPALVEIMHTLAPGQLYDHIDLTICVSNSAARMQPCPDKTRVIVNGIDLDDFPFRRKERCDGKIVLLQAARRQKDMFFSLDELEKDISAMAPDAELWLAGPGQDGGSTAHVKKMGLVKDMAGLYNSADLLVMLSKKETLGIATIEAMACGCVPIVADDAGLKEVVTDQVNGFVVDGSDRAKVVEIIGHAMKMVNTGQIDHFRSRGRCAVEKNFDIRNQVAQYQKTIIGLVDRKGRRTAPGPIKADPPPEVDIYEALDHYHQDNWGKAVENLELMTKRGEPLRVEAYMNVARNFIKLTESTGRSELSDAIFRKLYNSGLREDDFFLMWYAVGLARGEKGPETEPSRHVSQGGEVTPEMIMSSALFLLKEGLAAHAAEALRRGMEIRPDAPELAGLYEGILKKLNGGQVNPA